MTLPDHQPKASTHEMRAAPEVDPRRRSRIRLTWVVLVTGFFMAIEFVGGVMADSIALLGDAFHMMTHFVATGISLLALILAARPAPPEKTFRYWRIEVLAALFNGILLIPLVGWIMWEAYERYMDPQPVQEWVMLAVGFAGLVANVVCAWILHAASHGDMNVRGAFIHMLADSISSVGVIVAGILMLAMETAIFDPIFAAGISILVLIWSVKLIVDSLRILLEAAPHGVKIEDVEKVFLQQKGIKGVHDIHLWVITSRMYSLTAHVVLEQDVRVGETDAIARDLDTILDERFDVTHTTYQFEANASSESPSNPS